jgi:hypothetical protein
VTLSIYEVLFLAEAYEGKRDTFCVVKVADNPYAKREDDKLIAKSKTKKDSATPIFDFDNFTFEIQRDNMLRIEVRHPFKNKDHVILATGGDKNQSGGGNKDKKQSKNRQQQQRIIDESEKFDPPSIANACVNSIETCLGKLILLYI